MSERFWKVTDALGRSCHGGTYQWSLPTWDARRKRWTPGEWTPRISDIDLCRRGYHFCPDAHLVRWLGPRIWRAEIAEGAEIVRADDKLCTSGPARLIAGTAWDETTARLFAVDCAARVLHLTTDERVPAALEAAFLFSLGELSADDLTAARLAAWYAAGDAARDVRCAAVAARDARLAAWYAAGATAVDAAGAVWCAAVAARDAQTADLLMWMEVER